MIKYYHGTGKRGLYFEGWYLKHQTKEGGALALIPAVHIDRTGRRSASLQIRTQCTWQESQSVSLMLSIATIPMAVGSFTGCICAIVYDGREYRLATYRGARVEQWSESGAEIRQGKYRFEAELLEEHKCPLYAPVEGNMGRTIHESLCAKVRYRFWCGETLLFEHTDCRASFEYADERNHHAKSAAT